MSNGHQKISANEYHNYVFSQGKYFTIEDENHDFIFHKVGKTASESS